MNNFFQQLNVLYLALLGGQILFAGVVYFLISGGEPANQSPDEAMFGTIVPIVILAAAGAAFFLNRQRMQQEMPKEEAAKAEHYRSTVILRSAMMEGANLFALIAAMVEGNMSYMLYFAVGLLAFLYFRPSRDEFAGLG